MFGVPSDPWLLAAYILGWLAFSYVFVSFGEHQIHRHLMHKKKLPKWIYRRMPYVLDVFEAHAIQHHAVWYREFDYEPDPVGKQANLDIKWTETFAILAMLAPIFGTLLWLFPLGGLITVAVVVVHNKLWNMLHRQMHIPQDAFFKNWKAFQFLARHHYMHHIALQKNYNVVFPLADWVMGSVAKPALADIREMLRLGYLQPRSARARQCLEAWRDAVAKRRQAQPEQLAHAH